MAVFGDKHLLLVNTRTGKSLKHLEDAEIISMAHAGDKLFVFTATHIRQFKIDALEMQLTPVADSVIEKGRAVNCATQVGDKLWTGSDCVRMIDVKQSTLRSFFDTACKASKI